MMEQDGETLALTGSAESDRSIIARIGPKLLISFALGGLFAWLAARGGVPLLPPSAAFHAVKPWAIPAYLATLLVLHYFRASRWRFLIAPVKHVALSEVLLLNWIGFFAIYILPLRIGELARPALTKLREGIPISVGFGTVAVERVFDGLLTSLCVAFTLFALPRLPTHDSVARHLPTYGYAALTLFVCAFIALGMFLWQRALAVRLTHWGAGLVSKRLAVLLAEKVGNVADGLRSIGSFRLAAGFLIESLAYWGINAFGVWLLGRGVGLPMNFGHAVAIMGVLAIGILLPTGPGLFGNFQLAVSACLKLFFAESIVSTQGAVLVFLLYVLQSSVMIVAGIIPLYALRLRLVDLVRISTVSDSHSRE
ncbi:MAG TPA: lysylphosphatidylglycerol synthase transmembrane domain-containing protein [Polyangiales bacterium]|nr:lysylphosphatidylglycerol synthase transmembrane domain-containing protein [Polyangiales bacterium]